MPSGQMALASRASTGSAAGEARVVPERARRERTERAVMNFIVMVRGCECLVRALSKGMGLLE